jgi:hypothetical protein
VKKQQFGKIAARTVRISALQKFQTADNFKVIPVSYKAGNVPI